MREETSRRKTSLDTLLCLPKTIAHTTKDITQLKNVILHLYLSSLADDTWKTKKLLDKGFQLFHRQFGPSPPTIRALPDIK